MHCPPSQEKSPISPCRDNGLATTFRFPSDQDRTLQEKSPIFMYIHALRIYHNELPRVNPPHLHRQIRITTRSNDLLSQSVPSTCRKAHPIAPLPPPYPSAHTNSCSFIKGHKKRVMGSQGRRRRTKARKPRFASLRRKLARSTSTHLAADHQQLDLFPLHPEPICHDRDHDHHVDRDRDHEEDDKDGNYVARFFDLECDTLNSILGSTVDPEQDARPPLVSTSEKLTPRGGLARKALKGRERWEFCNEDEEGEGSNGGGAGGKDAWWDTPRRMLRLKLDYEEIMTAWSDKGPLFVDGEGAQVVPESHQHHLYDSTTSVFVDVGGGNNSSCSSSNLWAVPENGDGSGGGGREARVMRYREKRQSRLFSRKIRYEVRKINAEKRPRVKGRFVKRTDED